MPNNNNFGLIWDEDKPKEINLKILVENNIKVLNKLDKLKIKLSEHWMEFAENDDEIKNNNLELFNGKTIIAKWDCPTNYFDIEVYGKIFKINHNKIELNFKISYHPPFEYGGEIVIRENGVYTYEFFIVHAFPKLQEQIIDFFNVIENI